MNMSHETKAKNLSKFLQSDFSRISDRLAKEICEKAGLDPERSNLRLLDKKDNPKGMRLEDYKRLLEA